MKPPKIPQAGLMSTEFLGLCTFKMLFYSLDPWYRDSWLYIKFLLHTFIKLKKNTSQLMPCFTFYGCHSNSYAFVSYLIFLPGELEVSYLLKIYFRSHCSRLIFPDTRYVFSICRFRSSVTFGQFSWVIVSNISSVCLICVLSSGTLV